MKADDLKLNPQSQDVRVVEKVRSVHTLQKVQITERPWDRG